MLTPGAHFAEAFGVRLNLPTEGVRSVTIPGALIVLAPLLCMFAGPPTSHRIGLGRAGRSDVTPALLFTTRSPRIGVKRLSWGIGTERPRFENLDALKC
jgi:hypothetical protein